MDRNNSDTEIKNMIKAKKSDIEHRFGRLSEARYLLET